MVETVEPNGISRKTATAKIIETYNNRGWPFTSEPVLSEPYGGSGNVYSYTVKLGQCEEVYTRKVFGTVSGTEEICIITHVGEIF